MGEEKVEQQQTQTGTGAQPLEPQTTPEKGKSELSPEQKTIVGLRAEVTRLKSRLSTQEEESDSSDSEDAPLAKKGKSWTEENDAEKTVANLQKRIKELESESRRTALDKEKSDASREHGVPMEVLADAKTPAEIWRKVSQWHKDVGMGKEETPPPQVERSSGSSGAGKPSPDKIQAMSPEEFERFKQSLRRK
jgi:uncharacterized small protein (DUF1192 family)